MTFHSILPDFHLTTLFLPFYNSVQRISYQNESNEIESYLVIIDNYIIQYAATSSTLSTNGINNVNNNGAYTQRIPIRKILLTRIYIIINYY